MSLYGVWGGAEVGGGSAGLGTTTPISSWVQNCNSHQSLRPDFPWVGSREELCWIGNPPHSQPLGGGKRLWQAKLGQFHHTAALCQAVSRLGGGGVPSQTRDPWGDWVWSRFLKGWLL